MRWNTEIDRDFAGGLSDHILTAADLGSVLGTWQPRTAKAFETGDGKVVWARIMASGDVVHTVAIAPDDGRREIGDSELFGSPMPAEWLTKFRAGLLNGDGGKKPTDWSKMVDGGWGFGVVKATKEALLVKTWLDVEGRLTEIQPGPEAPRVPIAGHVVTKWYGLTKWGEGAGVCWQRGDIQFRNYRALCSRLWSLSHPDEAKAARERGLATMRANKAAKAEARKGASQAQSNS